MRALNAPKYPLRQWEPVPRNGEMVRSREPRQSDLMKKLLLKDLYPGVPGVLSLFLQNRGGPFRCKSCVPNQSHQMLALGHVMRSIRFRVELLDVSTERSPEGGI